MRHCALHPHLYVSLLFIPIPLFVPTLRKLRPHNYSGFHPRCNTFRPPPHSRIHSIPFPVLLHLILSHLQIFAPRFGSSRGHVIHWIILSIYVSLLPLLYWYINTMLSTICPDVGVGMTAVGEMNNVLILQVL